jgi:hypothetical protein
VEMDESLVSLYQADPNRLVERVVEIRREVSG